MQYGDNIFLDTKAYNEFIQRQLYVDETRHHHPLIIFELISTNPMEHQSQNIFHHDSLHFEIPDDGSDEDAQDKRKKSDLLYEKG